MTLSSCMKGSLHCDFPEARVPQGDESQGFGAMTGGGLKIRLR